MGNNGEKSTMLVLIAFFTSSVFADGKESGKDSGKVKPLTDVKIQYPSQSVVSEPIQDQQHNALPECPPIPNCPDINNPATDPKDVNCPSHLARINKPWSLNGKAVMYTNPRDGDCFQYFCGSGGRVPCGSYFAYFKYMYADYQFYECKPPHLYYHPDVWAPASIVCAHVCPEWKAITPSKP